MPTSPWAPVSTEAPYRLYRMGMLTQVNPFHIMVFINLYSSVFLLDEPEKIPRHNIYEFVWFLKTGLTRYF